MLILNGVTQKNRHGYAQHEHEHELEDLLARYQSAGGVLA